MRETRTRTRERTEIWAGRRRAQLILLMLMSSMLTSARAGGLAQTAHVRVENSVSQESSQSQCSGLSVRSSRDTRGQGRLEGSSQVRPLLERLTVRGPSD